jgi:L-malate glycosyltransferase
MTAVDESRNRVLMFSTAPGLGGGEIYVERLAKGLCRRFRISVLANPRLLQRIDAPVKKWKLGYFPQTVERNIPGGYRVKQIYHYLRHGIRPIFKRSCTDLVHVQIYDERLLNLITPQLVGRGIPRLITMHNEFNFDQVRKNRYRVRETLAEFSAIICTSNATKLNLIRLGIPQEKCHVIRNGVDTQKFSLNKRAGNFITWIGRLEQDKNPMLFVRIAELAHRQNLPLQFRIVGEGPLRSSIEAHIANRGMHNLEMYGWIDDPQKIYQEARVLCVTSTTETTPLVISEAMASGVPVVASNVGGIPEMIKDDSVGALVTTFDEADFLREITSLCADTNRHAALSRNGREWVEQAFSLERMVNDVAGIYSALLDATNS